MTALLARISATRGRRVLLGARWLAPGFVAAWVVVLFAHGLVPGRVNDLPANVLAEGAMRCVNDLGVQALWTRCHDFGEPVGYPLLTGGPVLVLGALLMVVPGVGSYPAYVMAGALFDGLALAGGYGLVRRLGAGRAVALGTAAVYLLSPTVIGLGAFGGTFYGFALLPAYVLVHLLVMDAVQAGGRRRLSVTFAAYAAVQTAALFLDGYSFMAANLVGAALWLAWGLPRRRAWSGRMLGAAVFVGANAVAGIAYLLYVPGVYEPNPIEVFRAMGLDGVTLVEPTSILWIPAELGFAADHSNLWGDGTNAHYNYAGFACLILAVAYVVRRVRHPEIAALAAAGAVAFVLSIGPSLKIDDARADRTARPDYNSYLMPAGTADVDLPWSGLFTALPGVDGMRASYRWFAVTRLVLVVLAGLAVAELARQRDRRWLAVAAVAVACAELAPNFTLLDDRYRLQREHAVAMRRAVTSDLQAITREGERAFFLNYDGSHNDYLANYFAAVADVRAYNAGGDKNALLARQHWSPTIAALAAPATPAEPVLNALRSGEVDVVIAPFFHLRWNAYDWPPTADEERQARGAFAGLLADPRLAVERRSWIAAIRLR